MLQTNYKKNNFNKKYHEAGLLISASAQVIQSTKKCNYRDENGWCNKSNRNCTFFKNLFINQ